MNHATSSEKLNKLLKSYTKFISYSPLMDEVDILKMDQFSDISEKMILISYDKETNPFILACEYKEQLDDEKVCILIPCQRFDKFGTRHGRGYGWYDRFLSEVPVDWLRIGIADMSKLSTETLIRQPWDEPMDWILAVDPTSYEFYETFAR